jgi:DNA-binding MarR family transcriptional regulator
MARYKDTLSCDDTVSRGQDTAQNSADGDHVDRVRALWAEQRPDLDTGPMALVARLGRVTNYVDHQLAAFFAEHDLTRADWDVLASLRRIGPPYRLSPTVLYRGLMRSSAGMTHRLARLEKRQLIRRIDDPDDRRGLLVVLTPRGRRLVDRLAAGHLDNERMLLAGLSAAEQDQLTELLRRLLGSLERDLPTPGVRKRSRQRN